MQIQIFRWSAIRTKGLAIVLIASILCETLADPRLLTIYNRVNYLGMVADFGDPIEGLIVTNLMLPPGNQLCEFHPTLLNATREDLDSNIIPIALFVPDSGCSAEKKARVLLQMQKNISKALKYIFIYSSDSFDRNELVTLEPTSNFTDDLASVGIIYIPSRWARGIQSYMNFEAEVSTIEPHFLVGNNSEWKFLVGMKPYKYPDIGSKNFGWFRFVLFALLIVSPCGRATFLWYSAGGRFRWRRNDRGRVVGLQYIPPMQHWLLSGPFPQQPVPRASVLTQEEFDGLPEIEYQLIDQTSKDEDDLDTNGHAEVCETGNAITLAGEEDIERSTNQSRNNSSHDSQQEGDLTTTSTICSICIDDFEMGEKITLLPRCRHAFHADCVKPVSLIW